MTPELQSKIAIWRQKAVEGTLTTDEMREAIIIMRQGRVSASLASDKARSKKAQVEIPNADDLLGELGEL